MIASRQRRVSPADQLCRVPAARLQRPESVSARTATAGGSSKWTVHDVVATPGQAAGWLPRPVPAGRPGVFHNEHQ
jgi:hypothetical protein